MQSIGAASPDLAHFMHVHGQWFELIRK
jgi:hypothetical protein